MKLIFVTLFVLAALAFVSREAWKRLNPERKSIVLGAVSRAAGAVGDMQRMLRDRLQRRQSAFRHVFLTETGALSPAGQDVMIHMARFCYAFSTTAEGKADHDTLMRREGRRQAYLEMLRMIAVDPLDVFSAAKQDELVLG